MFGLEPACVTACPTEALIFGNLKDKESQVAKLISTNYKQVLKPGMGTSPRVYYIGTEKDLAEIEGTPYR